MAQRNMFVDYTFAEVKSRMIEQPEFIAENPAFAGKEYGIILKPTPNPRLTKAIQSIDLFNGTWSKTSLPQINNALSPITKTWQKENVINIGFFDIFTGANFNNDNVTFDLVFFPNSFIERLLKYSNSKEGIRFRKSYCFWNGEKYQNLISEVYPYGYITSLITSPIVQGENIADYNYGFACPPDWTPT